MSPKKLTKSSETGGQFASGRERILAARNAAEAAQALKQLDADLPDAAEIAPAASGVVEGVRIIWVDQGRRAARDETAFRHALATAHRMKQAGQVLKDAKIIDAYERGYIMAQAVGADDREPDMPPMRDRLTMARRVRGYVTAGITNPTSNSTGQARMTSRGRKALATMGRRGGHKAAQRWNDPKHTDYQNAARTPLAQANQRREWRGDVLKSKVKSLILDARLQTGADPSTKELATELGVSITRIKQLRQALGMQAKRGRPKKG